MKKSKEINIEEGYGPEVQEAFDRLFNAKHKTRKIIFFISCGIAVLNFFAVMISNLGSGFGFAVALAAFLSFTYGFGLLGLNHGWHSLKDLFKKIPFLFAIVIAFFVAACAVLVGGIYAVVDTVYLILKKPLVFKYERKEIFESDEIQEILVRSAMRELSASASAENNMEKLRKLKEMKDEGVITEEEYNAKKAELLENI